MDDDKLLYRVVINHEEQYSIWRDGKDIPLGWSDIGQIGTKNECLEYIKQVWVNILPLSMRKK